MIVFFPVGQLGNQIFQYAFVDGIRKPNERILSSYCEYFEVFDEDEKKFLFINRYLRFILRRVLGVLAKLRIVTYINQARHVDTANNEIFECETRNTQGLFKNIRLVEGFFQSEKFITNKYPQIKKAHLLNAEIFLANVPSGAKKVAVHIRRGDYLTWKVLGEVNPSLPEAYYKKIINDEVAKNPECHFIFLSNDAKFVESAFSDLKNKIISKNTVAIDFAIMSMCDSGILSNSTLAWWAGQFMRPSGTIYAPKFWLGWKSNVWYPQGIETKKFKYIEV